MTNRIAVVLKAACAAGALASFPLLALASPTPIVADPSASPAPYLPANDDQAIVTTSLAGTKWHGQTNWIFAAGGSQTQTWDIEFRPDGVMHYVYVEDGRAFDNGHWRQRGALLFWDTNSMFCAAMGIIRGDEMQGTKTNIRGDTGTFTFKRVTK